MLIDSGKKSDVLVVIEAIPVINELQRLNILNWGVVDLEPIRVIAPDILTYFDKIALRAFTIEVYTSTSAFADFLAVESGDL